MAEQRSYEDIINNDAVTNTKMGMQSAVDKQPDAEARLQSLAKQYNIPVDTVRLDPKAIEHKSQLDAVDYDALVKSSPNTSNLLSDPNKAAIAHDDVDNLSSIEGQVRNMGAMRAVERTPIEAIWQPFATGYQQAKEGIYNSVHDVLGLDNAETFAATQLDKHRNTLRYPAPDDIEAGMQAISAPNQTWGGALSAIVSNPRAATEILQNSLGSTAPSTAATLAAWPMGVGARVATAGVTSLINEYGTSLSDTLSEKFKGNATGPQIMEAMSDPEFVSLAREKAVKRGVAVGTFDAITAGVAGKFLAMANPTKKSVAGMVAAEFAAQATGGAAGEATAQYLNNEDKKGEILMEALGEIPTGVIDSSQSYIETYDKLQQADRKAKDTEELMQVVSASKVLQRDPAMIHDFISRIKEEGSAENFFIDANTLQQSGMAEKLSELLPDVAAQLPEMLATGGELKIPIADFLTRVSTSDIGPALVDHLRVEGEDFTRAQATEHMNDHAADLQAHVERVMNAQNTEADHVKSRDAVKAQALDKLNAMGRFSPTVNEFYATLEAHRAATRGAQLGITPEEMYAKQHAGYVGEGMDSHVFDQVLPNALVDGMEIGDANKLAAMYRKEDKTKAVLLGQADSRLIGDALKQNAYLGTFSHSGTQSGLNHIRTQHGEGGKEIQRGQLPIRDADIAQIDGIIKNYDAVRFDLVSKSGNPMIAYAKQTPDGALLYFEEVHNKRHDLVAHSMRRYPATSDAVDILHNVPLYVQNGDGHINSIGKPPEASKPFDSKEDENTDFLYQADKVKKEKPEPKNAITGNLDKVNPAAKDAVLEYLSRRSTEEQDRITTNLKDHVGTAWAAAAVKGMAYREMLHRAMEGRNIDNLTTNEMWGGQDMANTKIIKAFKLFPKKGDVAITSLINQYDFVGGNRKAENDVSTSFANCNPSDACAVHCYAAGSNARPNEIAKSEFTEFALENYLKEATDRIAKIYGNTDAGEAGLSLRLNDKGDLSEAQINLINNLNDQGISLQIFSKRPELLRKIDDINLKMLSVDDTNMSVATDNPDLRLAVVITDGMTEEMLELIHDRVSVYLPVNLKGNSVSSEELKTRFPNLYPKMKRENLCPVDGGKMITLPNTSFVDIQKGINKGSTEKVWTCTACDAYGAAGCFKGDRQTTQRNAAAQSQNIQLSDVKKELAIKNARIELQKQLDLLQKLGDINGQQHETISRTLLKGSADIRLDVDGGAKEVATGETSAIFSREPESGGRTGRDDSGSGEGGSGRKHFPIKQVFNQGRVGNRGSFNPSTNIIAALHDADLTTVIHELGHFFFENDIALAAQLIQKPDLTAGEQSILNDMSAVFTWQGIQGTIGDQLDQWYTMSFEEQRSFHEQTAESFEHYTFTGKAPSMELQRVFDTFRSWLASVYKSIKAFLLSHPQAATLTPEVRAYFDRMLATTEQIQLAEQGRSMMPLFATREEARMSEAEFAEYQALGNDATNAAISSLAAKANKDMQWMNNARSKALKKMQRQHDELRRDIRSKIRIQVMAEPVYQAWSFLTRRMNSSDKAITPDRPKSNPNYVDESQDSLFVAIAKLGGLVKKDIEEEWGLDPATRSPMPVFGKHVLKRNGGLAIDDMGEALLNHGYLTPDEFGKFDQKEFEEKFGNELRGHLEYSTALDGSIFAEEGKAGEHIVNPWGLEAGRIELAALKGMIMGEEIEQRIIELKMTARNGLDPDVISEIIDGFSSGDELVRALATAEHPRDLINRLTDQKMMEDHSEIATPEARQAAADEAIHNAVRAKFVTREANALAQAAGTPRMLASAAKEYAAHIIRGLKIRDIKPHQYVLAQARAAKAALKASKAGNLKTAASEKRNQAISLYASKEAYDALDNVKSIIKYFKKFAGDNKKIDIEYLNQIRDLLAKFDLSDKSGKQLDDKYKLQNWVADRLAEGEIPVIAETMLNPTERAAYVAAIESRDSNGELRYMDDADRLTLLAAAIDNSATRSYKEATYEELLGLSDTIKQIEHMGRFKNKLLTNRDKLNFEEVRDKIVDGIKEHGGKANKNVRDPTDTLGKMGKFFKGFGAAHIKVATWARVMDGGIDNGPVWRYFIKPANERAAQETEMKAAATKVLSDTLSPILKSLPYKDKSSKGISFAALNGESLNWQDRFSFLLNMGNESNLQRLMAGGIAGKVEQLTMAQIMEVVSTLSPADIHAAQVIWDHFESYRPLIAEKELRVSGVEPKWIPVRAIDIKANDGSIIALRGGYYPVKFDKRANMMSAAHAQAQEAKDMMKASYSAATTSRSFTKERVPEVNGRPLMLGLTGLYSGINDIIHDLAWHEWVIDANKLLRSQRIDIAIREHYGSAVKDEFAKWRDDIVAGQKRLDHNLEKAAGFARQNVSASALTFNLMSAAMQPLGLSNSIARLGANWVAVGVGHYIADPIQATKDAKEKSKWMSNRTRTQFRELNELRNQVQGETAIKELMGKYGYWLMTRSQLMVDVPTWWGGYEKAIADGQNEDTAIALADQGVKDSQGGGEEVDQSGIERGPALVKLFTSFYGFMGTTLNTAYGSTITESNKAKIAVNLLLTLSVPVVLGHFLKAALMAGDDDDDDNLAGKLLREQLQFCLGTIAFGREFGGLLNDKNMGYSGPTGLRIIPDTFAFVKQAGQGQFDDAFRKQFVNILGDISGIPSVQTNRTITGVKALADGQTANPLAIGFGFR